MRTGLELEAIMLKVDQSMANNSIRFSMGCDRSTNNVPPNVVTRLEPTIALSERTIALSAKIRCPTGSKNALVGCSNES